MLFQSPVNPKVSCSGPGLPEPSHRTATPVIAREPIIAASQPASRSSNSWACRSSDGRRLAPATTTACAVVERHGSAMTASRTPARHCQVTRSMPCALAWARTARGTSGRRRRAGLWLTVYGAVGAVHGHEGTDICRKVGGRCWRDLCGRTTARKGVRSPLSLRPRNIICPAAGHFLRHRVRRARQHRCRHGYRQPSHQHPLGTTRCAVCPRRGCYPRQGWV